KKVVGQGTILVPTLCVGTPLATLRVAAAPLMKRDVGGAAATQSVAEGGSHAERGNQGQRRANEGYFPAAASSAGWEEASKTRRLLPASPSATRTSGVSLPWTAPRSRSSASGSSNRCSTPRRSGRAPYSAL